MATGARWRKRFGSLQTSRFIYEDCTPRVNARDRLAYFPELTSTGRDADLAASEALRVARADAACCSSHFNAKTEGTEILRAIADIDMFWVEIDSYNPQALAYIRKASPHPISSCETLLTLREFLPYFREQAMDVAIVDTPWNGVWQSMKIAACAEAHEVNVAPHNFYGHLCTMMNAHFVVFVPNLRIMEIDIDRLPWDDELFSTVPKIENGQLVMSDAPGWGIEPDEAALKAHPPKQHGGLDYGRRPTP